MRHSAEAWSGKTSEVPGIPFRQRGPFHVLSSACLESPAIMLGKQKTGWNVNSNRLQMRGYV